MDEYSDIPEGFKVEESYSDVPKGFWVEPEPEPKTQSEQVFKSLKILPLGDIRGGVVESLAQYATGAIATPVAGLAGIGASLIPGGKTGAEAVQQTQEALTYQPRTQMGQKASETINIPFRKLENFADVVGEVTGKPEQTLGATAVKTAIMAAPMSLGFRGRSPLKATPKQELLETANKEGYVAPPLSAKPSSGTASALEGVGGKLKTEQSASVSNQAVTNRLASRALGLSEDTVLTPDALSAIRKNAGQSYENVRNAGTIISDVQFKKDLSGAVQRFKSAAKDFPKVAKSEIIAIVEDLRKPAFDAGSGVDAITIIRDKADIAFRAGDKTLGRAYRAASDALENVIERHLTRTKADPALIESFKNSRQEIAKTYTVENALVGSDVSAPKLAGQLNKGKPLSGELKLIAEFSRNFPKATKVVNESKPAFSPLDVIVGGSSVAGAAVTGSPMALLPLALSLSRPAARAIALSQKGQRLARPRPGVIKAPAILPTAGAVTSGQRENQ